jgi:AraC-like DNA-binding protein
MPLYSGKKLNTLIGGSVAWANRRLAGRAYRYHARAQNNSVTLVLTGRARYVVNGNGYTLGPGMMSFVSRGDDLEITAIGKSLFSFLVVMFSLYDIDGKSVSLSALNLPYAGEVRRAGRVRRRMLALLREYHGHAQDRTANLSSGLLAFLHEALAEMSGRPAEKALMGFQAPASLERAAEYAYRNLGRKITLKDLATQACLDASYFSRLFRKATGETPMEFVRRLKVERAGTVLLNSDLTIGQVSEMFGFQSQAHFSRKFKKISGLSPLAFVRKHKGK